MAPLIQFNAGRSNRLQQTNTIQPEPAKGLIYLQQEDGLLHFCYKNLETNLVDDLIIFPGDATFKPVAPNSRSYVLKFASSSHRHFFWHQDVDPSHDEERSRTVNRLMSGEEEEEAVAAVAPGDDAMQVEDSPPIASTSRSTAQTAAPALGTTEQMAQLQAILSGMSSARPQPQQQELPQYLLNDILDPSLLTPLISRTLPSLTPFLPPTLPPTQETANRVIRSREFKRSVASLDRALRTGALGPLVVGLGLKESSAEGVEAFLEGIMQQAKEEKDQEDKMETE